MLACTCACDGANLCVPNHNEHCRSKLCALRIRHCHCQTAAQMVRSVVASKGGLACDARPLCAHKPSPLLASAVVHSCSVQHVSHALDKPLRDVQLICHMHAACTCSCTCLLQMRAHAPTWDEGQRVEPLLREHQLRMGPRELIPVVRVLATLRANVHTPA